MIHRAPMRTVAVLVVAGALTLTACTPTDPAEGKGATTQPSQTPASTHQPSANETTEDDPDAFRTGQPADNGAFEPLVLPAGIPYGADVIPDDSYLDESGLIDPGNSAVIFSGYWSKKTTYRSTFLFALDAVTEPLAGADYDAVYNALGLAQGGAPHGTPIQRFGYRAREVAAAPGEDDASTFDLVGMMTGLDYAGNSNYLMISENGPLGCVGDPTPFDEHGWETGDTVQGCGYAATLPGGADNVWFYGIRLNGRLSDSTTPAPRVFTTGVHMDNPSAGHDE